MATRVPGVTHLAPFACVILRSHPGSLRTLVLFAPKHFCRPFCAHIDSSGARAPIYTAPRLPEGDRMREERNALWHHFLPRPDLRFLPTKCATTSRSASSKTLSKCATAISAPAKVRHQKLHRLESAPRNAVLRSALPASLSSTKCATRHLSTSAQPSFKLLGFAD